MSDAEREFMDANEYNNKFEVWNLSAAKPPTLAGAEVELMKRTHAVSLNLETKGKSHD